MSARCNDECVGLHWQQRSRKELPIGCRCNAMRAVVHGAMPAWGCRPWRPGAIGTAVCCSVAPPPAGGKSGPREPRYLGDKHGAPSSPVVANQAAAVAWQVC